MKHVHKSKPARKTVKETSGWHPWVRARALSNGGSSWVAYWKERKPDGGSKLKRKQYADRAALDAWLSDEHTRRSREGQLVRQAERRGDSVVTLANLSPSERAALASAVETLRTAGGTVESITKAASLYVASHLRGAKKTVAEIVAEHLEALQQRRRAATVSDRRHNLKTFLEAHGDNLASSITTRQVEDWVLSIDKTPSQAARRRAVSALFNYAKKRGYLTENPVEMAERIDAMSPDEIPVFTAAEAHEIMRRAKRMEPHLVPYLAVGLFAGLRPQNELQNLDWSNINMEAKLITVTRRTSKTSLPRHVPIQPNLAAWLRSVPKSKRKGSLQFSRRALRHVLGRAHRKGEKKLPPIRWAQDIMRHSYGSYRQTIIKNINQLVEEMGNTPSIARAHYLNPQSQAEAKKFWAVKPSNRKGH